MGRGFTSEQEWDEREHGRVAVDESGTRRERLGVRESNISHKHDHYRVFTFQLD